MTLTSLQLAPVHELVVVADPARAEGCQQAARAYLDGSMERRMAHEAQVLADQLERGERLDREQQLKFEEELRCRREEMEALWAQEEGDCQERVRLRRQQEEEERKRDDRRRAQAVSDEQLDRQRREEQQRQEQQALDEERNRTARQCGNTTSMSDSSRQRWKQSGRH